MRLTNIGQEQAADSEAHPVSADGVGEDFGTVHVARSVKTSPVEDCEEEEAQDGEAVTNPVVRVLVRCNERGVDTQIYDASDLLLMLASCFTTDRRRAVLTIPTVMMRMRPNLSSMIALTQLKKAATTL